MTGPPARGLYRVALTPADVGARVVVRRRRPHAVAGEPPLGDVLGDLLSWESGTLVVRTRSGELVAVSEASVVAAKRVPPPPPRRTPGRDSAPRDSAPGDSAPASSAPEDRAP